MGDNIYYDPKFLESIKSRMTLSPSTAHKVFNPMCGKCLYEHGTKYTVHVPDNYEYKIIPPETEI